MKAPLSWLKDYVDIDVSAQTLQEKLFSCGFEVEELIELGKDITGVVVGEVLQCEAIEGTHLHICQVDCGKHGTFQICCGAENVAVGIKAPTALVGATVYATAKDHVTIEGVMTIKKGKLRGVDSFGMLCSGVEIGVNGDMFEGGDVNGLLLLPTSWENGADVKPLLGLDDYIFDVGITANRPDCQSILGLAREVAAVLNKPVKMPACDFTAQQTDDAPVNVSVLAPELCKRYIAHYVKDVKIAPSPAWIKKRLALCGLRSINNVVDITNFILLELGQPMHAFDCDSLSGRQIIVRRANEGEKIITLDEKEFALTKENLVICDGDKPCALAGIMGGANSEIKDSTTHVLFESAKFARDSVRRTARALGQHSDSSSAFEKGVNEYTTELAIKRALHLIQALQCGTVTQVCADVTTEYSLLTPKKMTVSIQKINALLGITVPTDAMVDILTRLEFEVSVNGDEMNLVVPRYREDIDGYPDIAEEIIREYGYEHVNGTFLPSASITNGGFNEEQKLENDVRDMLVAQGAYEISTYSFYSPKDLDMLNIPADDDLRKFIRIKNPIGEDLSVMRTTMAPSMVNTVVRNLRRGNMEGKLFEIASVYLADELPLTTFPKERKTLCIGYFGNYDFFDLKGVTEYLAERLHTKFEYVPATRTFLHPGVTAEIICEGETIGYLGKLDPTLCEKLAVDRSVLIAEINYEAMVSHAKPFRYEPLSKFPTVERDLAFICDEQITCADVEQAIFAACKYVSKVKLFDLYTGAQIAKGKKSMAFNVTFTPKNEAITPENADSYVKKILAQLERNLGVALR